MNREPTQQSPGPAAGPDSIDPARVRRASAVAREYDALMGLSLVVLGLGSVVAGLTGQTAVYLAIGAALSGASASWYIKRYGRVRAGGLRNLWIFAGAMTLVVILLVAYVLDRWLQLPVLLTLLGLAASLAIGQFLMLRRTGLTPAHWCVYAALALAALAPVVGGPRGAEALAYVLVCAGVALIVLGLVDHRRLVQILGPAETSRA
ncbi:MAG: hypothetical protein ABWX96_18700 [Propionibacteriaceae bacterium]